MNTDRSIITSASNKFFPSVINLIGSIKHNYPNHPSIYVYDLGLSYLFRKELESIDNVKVVDFTPFVPFWRSCYTWKSFIFKNPFTDYTLYIDAGCQVLRPLDEIFLIIEKDSYFLVDQKTVTEEIVPEEYKDFIHITREQYDEFVVTAGIFGFNKNADVVQKVINKLYSMSVAGLCLGYSKNELWKNKGVNKTNFIRDCKTFRHDTTLLTILSKEMNLTSHDSVKYAGFTSPTDHPEQFIWNMRMNFSALPYILPRYRNKSGAFSLLSIINYGYIALFMFLKRIKNTITKKNHA